MVTHDPELRRARAAQRAHHRRAVSDLVRRMPRWSSRAPTRIRRFPPPPGVFHVPLLRPPRRSQSPAQTWCSRVAHGADVAVGAASIATADDPVHQRRQPDPHKSVRRLVRPAGRQRVHPAATPGASPTTGRRRTSTPPTGVSNVTRDAPQRPSSTCSAPSRGADVRSSPSADWRVDSDYFNVRCAFPVLRARGRAPRTTPALA